jgi:hypothetical protein
MKRTLIVMLASAVAVCAADPFAGTWKLDVAKSKSDGPMAKSATVTITAIENGQTVMMQGVSAEGKPVKTSSRRSSTARITPLPVLRSRTR